MFVIDNMKKSFTISFLANIGLALLLIIMTILYFTKGFEEVDNPGLQDLVIDEASINFDSSRYAYNIVVDETVDKLNISVIPYDKSATVKIDGNDNLKIGYNQVTISVKGKEGSAKIYYIEVDKNTLELDEEIEKEIDEEVDSEE